MDEARAIGKLVLGLSGFALATLLVVLVLGRQLDRGPFSPAPWRNVDGRAANPRTFMGPGVPFEHRGSDACAWGAVDFIAFMDGQYVRDPQGKVVAQARRSSHRISYDAHARLPRDATSTGWSRGGEQLWVSPADVNSEGVYANLYVVWPDHVERLPDFGLGCA